MNHRWRYYVCRGTYPTATRPKTCNGKHINAQRLEDTVWKNIREVLEKPEVVLAGVKEQLESHQGSGIQGVSIKKEAEKLRKNIRSYAAQEKRLIELFSHSEINKDFLLDEINKIKNGKAVDEETLDNLIQSQKRIEQLQDVGIKLTDYCQRLKTNLDSASFQDKRDVLDMLAISVTVTKESTKIDGVIPLETTPSKESVDGVNPNHHWTNMGMNSLSCIGLPFMVQVSNHSARGGENVYLQ